MRVLAVAAALMAVAVVQSLQTVGRKYTLVAQDRRLTNKIEAVAGCEITPNSVRCWDSKGVAAPKLATAVARCLKKSRWPLSRDIQGPGLFALVRCVPAGSGAIGWVTKPEFTVYSALEPAVDAKAGLRLVPATVLNHELAIGLSSNAIESGSRDMKLVNGASVQVGDRTVTLMAQMPSGSALRFKHDVLGFEFRTTFMFGLSKPLVDERLDVDLIDGSGHVIYAVDAFGKPVNANWSDLQYGLGPNGVTMANLVPDLWWEMKHPNSRSERVFMTDVDRRYVDHLRVKIVRTDYDITLGGIPASPRSER